MTTEIKAMKGYDCSCDKCKALCMRPCWPSPEEAKKLIKEGYGNRLMRDYWVGDENIFLLCPAIKGHEGQDSPWWPTGQCTFQNDDGLCEIHHKGLKPIEGRLAGCREIAPKGLHSEVAGLWDNFDAQKLVKDWKKSRT